MRRGISIALVIFGLLTAVAGIWKLFPPANKTVYPPHIIASFIFLILVIIHVWLNRKAILKYFSKLGWKWIWVILGFALVIYYAIMPLIIF
jgi:uncharacterized membrane protein